MSFVVYNFIVELTKITCRHWNSDYKCLMQLVVITLYRIVV